MVMMFATQSTQAAGREPFARARSTCGSRNDPRRMTSGYRKTNDGRVECHRGPGIAFKA